MELLKFYKNTLTTLGYEVTSDNYVKVKVSDDSSVLLTVGGKSLVLPTKEHIDTSISVDDDGKPVITKVLYNPLSEDAIRGETPSLKLTKDTVEKLIAFKFMSLGNLLLKLAADPKLQAKSNHELNKFLGKLQTAGNAATKHIVDDKSAKLWDKIYQKSLLVNSSDGLCRVHMKKQGIYNGVKYHRLTTLGFPIYDLLEEADKDTDIFNVKLRPKDIKVYRLLYEYVFDKMDTTSVISVGSMDNDSPGFISLMTVYINVVKRINVILKGLKGIDEEYYDAAWTTVSLHDKEMNAIPSLKSQVVMIPSTIDINRKLNTPAPAPAPANGFAPPPTAPVTTIPTVANPVMPAAQPAQQPVAQPAHQAVQQQQPPAQQMDDGLTPMQRALRNSGAAVVPTINTQQPMQPGMAQQPVQQIQQSKPIAPNAMPVVANSMGQQQQLDAYGRPMLPPMQQQQYVQQPVYGQQPMGYPQQQGYGYGQQPMQSMPVAPNQYR